MCTKLTKPLLHRPAGVSRNCSSTLLASIPMEEPLLWDIHLDAPEHDKLLLSLNELHRTKQRFGVVSMCIGTGMGAAAVIEVEPKSGL